jgi:predicted AlkP superfamily pyrophosphatase or phosphodiesterase
MNRLVLFISLFTIITSSSQAQPAQKTKPKIIIGLVIDQMRWDNLYRYSDHYGTGGFKRLLNEGFSCENTMIPYTPTVTACGHTCIYTGSVPAITGITGNNWWDYTTNKEVYCTDDTSYTTVGSNTKAGQMSPNRMLVTTITDELRLATNFKSKVIGIALKDRGAILPAGHSANAAYWYDGKNGNWITSSYYMNALPDWANQFNNRKIPDSLLALNWNTLYAKDTYTQSTSDEENYERKFDGETTSSFPHNFDKAGDKKYGLIRSAPQGNTLTFDFAKATIEGEQLGMSGNTDFLAISCSSTDYIGHQFGPNSVENEDDYVRLDKDIADFLHFLDNKYGKGNYLFFLTADHGVAHIPGFLKQHTIPSGSIDGYALMDNLNAAIKAKFGLNKVIVDADNYQLTFNYSLLDSAKITRQTMIDFLLPQIKKINGVANAFDIEKINETTLPEVQKKMLSNGYNAKRSGDIQIIFQPAWIDGGATGTTHGLWNPYDAHIPLVWFGWNITHGQTNEEVYMTDIAPTLAALLHIQMPNGCIGKPIVAITK